MSALLHNAVGFIKPLTWVSGRRSGEVSITEIFVEEFDGDAVLVIDAWNDERAWIPIEELREMIMRLSDPNSLTKS